MIEAFVEWLTFMPNLAAMLIIATFGAAAKRLILGPKHKWPRETLPSGKKVIAFTGAKGVYVVTYRTHAIFLGMAAAALGSLFGGLPVPEHFEGDGLAGALLNYGGDGAAAMILYASFVGQGKSLSGVLKAMMNGRDKS